MPVTYELAGPEDHKFAARVLSYCEPELEKAGLSFDLVLARQEKGALEELEKRKAALEKLYPAE